MLNKLPIRENNMGSGSDSPENRDLVRTYARVGFADLTSYP